MSTITHSVAWTTYTEILSEDRRTIKMPKGSVSQGDILTLMESGTYKSMIVKVTGVVDVLDSEDGLDIIVFEPVIVKVKEFTIDDLRLLAIKNLNNAKKALCGDEIKTDMGFGVADVFTSNAEALMVVIQILESEGEKSA